ncbi:MAG: hypothetical protein ABSF99_12135 [Anaerolineales bacterium]
MAKNMLGEIPFTAEMYWLLHHRGNKIHSRFNLDALKVRLPEMVAQVTPYAESATPVKKVFIFASMHSWIRHAVVTGLVLRGLGYDVTLGYLPYSDYDKPIDRFDLRRQDLYARHVLKDAQPLLRVVSFLDLEAANEVPAALIKELKQVTTCDTQYTLQREDVTGDEPIYRLRQERNLEAARKAFAYFRKYRPDIVIIPNGMIQEYGAVYHAAFILDIPTVTYEFGEQDQRVWLAQNQQVMYFNAVEALWATRRTRKLDKEQRTWLESFLLARQGLSTGEKFAHLWQKTDREGSAKTRAVLGLDDRPIVLLPTNVLGDSATLGRTIFSRSMTEWVERVVPFLANRPEVQLVVRIHPAETWTVGPSLAETIRKVLPDLPSHIRMIGPEEKINTYDLMEITDLALVYTTHAGLEMATRGIPVLVSGKAHYRRKGFTLDADTWDEYFTVLTQALTSIPARLTPEQLELAWNYAYSFFAEYPRPFPWHLEKIWRSLDKRPLAYVLSPDGRNKYEATFQQMAGMPMDWKNMH